MSPHPMLQRAAALIVGVSMLSTGVVSVQESHRHNAAADVVVASSGLMRSVKQASQLQQAASPKQPLVYTTAAPVLAVAAAVATPTVVQPVPARVVAAGWPVGSSTLSCGPSDAPLETLSDLEKQQCNIFPTGNLNAASFKWAAFLLGRANSLSSNSFLDLNTGYCPISGAPITGSSTARITLRNALGGAHITGRFHYEDTTCICVAMDLVMVDFKTVSFTDGTMRLPVLVIGDPCGAPDDFEKAYFLNAATGEGTSLSKTMPEVVCNTTNGQLQGAVMSEGGFPIVGLLYTEDSFDMRPTDDADLPKWRKLCGALSADNDQAGKGYFLRRLAEVSPIDPPTDGVTN